MLKRPVKSRGFLKADWNTGSLQGIYCDDTIGSTLGKPVWMKVDYLYTLGAKGSHGSTRYVRGAFTSAWRGRT